MARRWRRRSFIIGIIIVALTVALVFATLAYLQPPPAPHASIQTTYSHSVIPGTPSVPGFYGLTIPDIAASEPFALKVSVTNGTARFCVLQKSIYENWAFNQSQMANTFQSQWCINGLTGEMSQGTLQFGINPGTWVVAALNYGSTELTVSFSPA
jgi:hypothetical protein